MALLLPQIRPNMGKSDLIQAKNIVLCRWPASREGLKAERTFGKLMIRAAPERISVFEHPPARPEAGPIRIARKLCYGLVGGFVTGNVTG